MSCSHLLLNETMEVILLQQYGYACDVWAAHCEPQWTFFLVEKDCKAVTRYDVQPQMQDTVVRIVHCRHNWPQQTCTAGTCLQPHSSDLFLLNLDIACGRKSLSQLYTVCCARVHTQYCTSCMMPLHDVHSKRIRNSIRQSIEPKAVCVIITVDI